MLLPFTLYTLWLQNREKERHLPENHTYVFVWIIEHCRTKFPHSFFCFSRHFFNVRRKTKKMQYFHLIYYHRGKSSDNVWFGFCCPHIIYPSSYGFFFNQPPTDKRLRISVTVYIHLYCYYAFAMITRMLYFQQSYIVCCLLIMIKWSFGLYISPHPHTTDMRCHALFL